MSKSWEQILGGYATDTLTEEEQCQLFEAALHDQALFDALADEEALKALLADPEARQRIVASLQTSGEPQGGASSFRSGWFWFRQPSSLAWAGSIAAMGLALIFGWQMEKDWGPMVQQEQQAERSVSENQDEVDFRSQQSPLKDQKPAVALKKNDERRSPSQVQPQSVLAPMPEADTGIAKSTEKLGQGQEAFKKVRGVKEKGRDSSSPRMLDQISQAPDTLLDQEQTQGEPAVEPLAVPNVAEVGKPVAAKLAPARERSADQAARDEPLLPPGALDQFYAGLGAEDPDIRAVRVDEDNVTLEKVSSEPSPPKVKEKKRLSVQGEIIGEEPIIQRVQGIRYSFIRVTEKEEEELAEGQEITGDWRGIRLTIEPNEAGFLYVLVPLGNDKWQQLMGMTSQKRVDHSDDGHVNAYQVVEFRLGGITNILGKLVTSSITALFSPTPLESPDKWVAGNVNLSELQVERTDDSVYVVRPGLASDAPLRVDITLKK